MAQGKEQEAFKHLEKQISINPTNAYAFYAYYLFKHVRRLKKDDKIKKKELAKRIMEIKRFYEVHNHLILSLRLREHRCIEDQLEKVLDWSNSLDVLEFDAPPRVEFVPVVAKKHEDWMDNFDGFK